MKKRAKKKKKSIDDMKAKETENCIRLVSVFFRNNINVKMA